jgi:hypothetical protein
VVALTNRIDIHKKVRVLDDSCELLQDEPVEINGKRRFIFSTEKGEVLAEKILRHLLKDGSLRIFEFQITKPDLETIFLRATKKNWEESDLLAKKSRRIYKENST